MARTILHVDDDPDIREAVKTILEAEGYAVVNFAVVADLVSDIDKMKNLPSLAILDVMVEKEDSGLRAYDMLRKMWPHLPVILLTSLGEMIRPYFEEEHTTVLIVEKPVSPERLLSMVNSHFQNSHEPDRKHNVTGYPWPT